MPIRKEVYVEVCLCVCVCFVFFLPFQEMSQRLKKTERNASQCGFPSSSFTSELVAHAPLYHRATPTRAALHL